MNSQLLSPRLHALVTGGSGFLGSHLCEQLLTRGLKVTSVDNYSTGNHANVAHLAGNPGFRAIDRDVTEKLVIHDDLDFVFHLASPASPRDYDRLPVQTLMAGSTGTLNALELARERQARFILASSSEVYGDPLEHPQREAYRGNVNPVGPRSSYDEAKRFAEALTTAYCRSYPISAGIARIFNSYGPRMRPGDGRAIPTFISQALLGEPITVNGDGSQTRSFCYVDDTIAGILALAESGHAGPVNIGSTTEISILRLADIIKDQTGSHSPLTNTDMPGEDPLVRRPDTTLARQLLGWQARVELTEGLKRTIRWFARQIPATSS